MLKAHLRFFALTVAALGILTAAHGAAPVITSQPTNQTVVPGGTAVFSVIATGTPPLHFSWRHDSQGISGANDAFLTLSNVQVSDVGYYTVLVGNSNGHVLSQPAVLGVYDTYSLDLPANFSLIANQLDQTNNNINTVIPVAPDGALLFRFNSALQQFESASTYFADPDPIVAGWYNSDGVTRSTNSLRPGEGAFLKVPASFRLTFNGVYRPPQLPLALTPGLNLLSRQIPREARYEQIVGLPAEEGKVVDQFDSSSQTYRSHTFFQGQWRDGVPLAQPGEAVFVSDVKFPIITQQPSNQTVVIGSTATFSVEVDGNPPLHYQWRRNGVSIPDATNATYAIPNAQLGDAGNYTVAVQPGRFLPGAQVEKFFPGAVFSDRALLRFFGPIFAFNDSVGAAPVVTNAAGALAGDNSGASVDAAEPHLAGKPGGHSVWMTWMAPSNGVVTFVTLGSSFDTLLAAYAGTNGPGTEIASDDDGGPFLSSRITFNATAGERYHIAVDGFAGASGDFVLSWLLEPTGQRVALITAQPQSQLVDLGSTAFFEVGAAGTNLSFQWFQDGSPINGATLSNYFIPSVQEVHAGIYNVRVSIGPRSVMSRGALLQIRPTSTGPGQDLPRAKGAGDTEPLAEDKFQDVVTAATNSALDLRPIKVRTKVGGVAHGFSGTQIFSTVSSSKEPGEPNHAGIVGGKSEWFSYQPTNNGTLKVDTDGSNFDTALAVYIGPGDSFTTLTNVASDNNSGSNGITSSVLFNATSNTIYYIAVDGVNNVNTGVAASGTVHLNYRLALPLTLTSLNYSSANNNGRVIFKINGTPNLTATVQSATDLFSPTWISLFTNTSANGMFNFTNTNALTSTNRLFRVLNKM